MDTAVRLFLAAIALLAIVNRAHADTGRGDAEVVLEADEIDSSTAKIARDITQTDYGHAVDRLGETPDTLSGKMARWNYKGTGERIANKLAAGALLGSGGAFLLGSLGATGCSSGDTFCGVGVLLGMLIAYPVGNAVGVSMVDPHDRFLLSLGGSIGGLVVGGIIGPNNLAQIDSLWELWPFFVGPTVGATWASEWFRDPPETRRFSKKMDDKAGWRIANKMGAGVLSGFAFGFLGAFSENENGASLSYVIGVPIGTTMVDSRDRFAYSLAGSLLGAGVAIAMKSGVLLLVVPPVTATLASELFRSPPEISQTSRFSVGLMPNSTGHLSAVATLRF